METSHYVWEKHHLEQIHMVIKSDSEVFVQSKLSPSSTTQSTARSVSFMADPKDKKTL